MQIPIPITIDINEKTAKTYVHPDFILVEETDEQHAKTTSNYGAIIRTTNKDINIRLTNKIDRDTYRQCIKLYDHKPIHYISYYDRNIIPELKNHNYTVTYVPHAYQSLIEYMKIYMADQEWLNYIHGPLHDLGVPDNFTERAINIEHIEYLIRNRVSPRLLSEFIHKEIFTWEPFWEQMIPAIIHVAHQYHYEFPLYFPYFPSKQQNDTQLKILAAENNCIDPASFDRSIPIEAQWYEIIKQRMEDKKPCYLK